MKDKDIFALDIGTRKVMGIIARKKEDFTEIIDVEVIEHPSRPMFDGQIHSIEEVARTVRQVKENLERRLNRKLSHAGVAVAGRNLVTYKNKVNREFPVEEEITEAMVRDLELEGVDRIISQSANNPLQFYCVGYSPVYYELDGNRFSDLIGHRAKSIAVEIIVTFLPRVVLDSMFAVLRRTGLEATNITLEPISAINAIIPADMRKLNIVLVDIGAGTSDLALTRDGFVFAYGMVPEAGDEITERISEVCLADFSTAERIKRLLNDRDKIEYEDIWGKRRKVGAEEIKRSLSSCVKKLAQSIAKSGLQLNGGTPCAVVAVGGGSQVFDLVKYLSEGFGLSPDKAGIRLPSAIKGIKDRTGKLTGPEAVTPIGIALMTVNSLGLRFIEIEINNKKFKMLDFQQKKDIMAALTLAGIVNNKKLYPRPGMAITCTVNGELKIIKGTLGRPAKILLNQKPVFSLSEKISEGDRIEFEEALNGENARVSVKDLMGIKPVQVVFNGEPVQVAPLDAVMNGEKVGLSAQVSDRADIRFEPLSIKDVLKYKGINLESLSERQILVNINGTPKILTQRNFTLRINGRGCGLEVLLKQNDAVEFSFDNPTFYRVKDVVDIPDECRKVRINVDGNDIEMKIAPVQIFMNGHEVAPEEFLIDGADIKVYSLSERKVLLSEIFRYIEFDTARAFGKNMKILVDGVPAGFTTPLAEGSKVRIIFEDRKS